MQIHTVSAAGENSVPWMNASGLAPAEIEPHIREVAMKLSNWMTDQQSAQGSLFDRRAYILPDNPYAAMVAARKAVQTDDLVSGAADVTEGLMFQGMKWESEVEDDADIFNQISADLDLDAYLRSAHRELFTYSQVITATWWEWKKYKVRGRSAPEEVPLEKITDPATGVVTYQEPRDPKTNRQVKPKRGAARRREYRAYVPVAMTILDPLRVIPIGSGNIWGHDRLAWYATDLEVQTYTAMQDGSFEAFDLTMSRLFLGKYDPPKHEAERLSKWGVDPKQLIELNPEFVWRHTLSKASYQEFPDLRMKSIFKLLDLKQQLMEADRVALIGAANYLMLVKKGTKEDPAYPEELRNLRENFDVVAKVPVIISDHRLEIEIITPKQDYTLQGEKYDTLDRRILSRLMGAMTVASSGQRNESTLTIGRMVARLLESQRHMLKRSLELHIARAICDHPNNEGTFDDEPNMAFTPRNVQLDSDAQVVQSIMALRAQKELSRGSTLEFFGFDQEVEAQRREYEDQSGLDATFGTQVPFNGGDTANAGGTPPPPPQVTGPQGGRPSGGGTPTQNAANPQTRNRTPKKG